MSQLEKVSKIQGNCVTLNQYFGLVKRDLPYVKDTYGGYPFIHGALYKTPDDFNPNLNHFPRNPYAHPIPKRVIFTTERGNFSKSPSEVTETPIFRSKREGICPIGWIPSSNKYCVPITEDQGMFYSQNPIYSIQYI